MSKARTAELFGVLLLLLVGCGGADEADEAEPTPAEDTPASTEAETAATTTETAATTTETEAATETETGTQPATPAEDGGTPSGGGYPEREITMIIPFPAGSANDVAFRTLSTVAETELGVPIVIVNRVGGAGTVGLSEFQSAEPDGYTIAQAPSAAMTQLPLFQDTTYEGPEDFTPFIQTHTSPLAVFVRADSDIADVDDFIARATTEPGAITMGVPCANCVLDLDLELLMRDVGGDLQYVPYQAGEQTVAVLNGSIDAGIGLANLVTDFVENGDMVIPFYFSDQPIPGAAAPIISETDYSNVAFVPSSYGLVPNGTPPERVQVLYEAFRAAIDSETFQEFAQTSGLLIAPLDPEGSAASLAEQAEQSLAAMRDLDWLD